MHRPGFEPGKPIGHWFTVSSRWPLAYRCTCTTIAFMENKNKIAEGSNQNFKKFNICRVCSKRFKTFWLTKAPTHFSAMDYTECKKCYDIDWKQYEGLRLRWTLFIFSLKKRRQSSQILWRPTIHRLAQSQLEVPARCAIWAGGRGDNEVTSLCIIILYAKKSTSSTLKFDSGPYIQRLLPRLTITNRANCHEFLRVNRPNRP